MAAAQMRGRAQMRGGEAPPAAACRHAAARSHASASQPYPVTGTTTRKLIVATGMCIPLAIQGWIAGAALGALVRQRWTVAAYIQIDGVSGGWFLAKWRT
jgi:hypothetical protein